MKTYTFPEELYHEKDGLNFFPVEGRRINVRENGLTSAGFLFSSERGNWIKVGIWLVFGEHIPEFTNPVPVGRMKWLHRDEVAAIETTGSGAVPYLLDYDSSF